MTTDPFESDVPEIDLVKVGEVAALAVKDAIQNAATDTARSKQAADYFLGISNLGHCRNYSALMTKQVEQTDVRDKTQAFFGTVAGKAVEEALIVQHPDWKTQVPLKFPIPSGGEIPGTCDILIPFSAQDPENGIYQGIWDVKSKGEMETIRRLGPNQQQVYQVVSYAKAAIAAGLLDPDHPILVGDVFFDRSGSDIEPHGVFMIYSEDTVGFIDEWINDVKYAVMNGEDASRDQPREFCASYCEYFTACRGQDTDVEGLITEPEFVTAAEMYREGVKQEGDGKKKKDAAKKVFDGRSGSTGKHTVRWITIDETYIDGYTRRSYTKVDVRDVPAPKAPKAKAKK